MRVVNVFDSEMEEGPGRDGFWFRAAKLGVRLGAVRIGAAVYEARAGVAIWPYHYHYPVRNLFETETPSRPTQDALIERSDARLSIAPETSIAGPSGWSTGESWPRSASSSCPAPAHRVAATAANQPSRPQRRRPLPSRDCATETHGAMRI
jgi:hypothetical protein